MSETLTDRIQDLIRKTEVQKRLADDFRKEVLAEIIDIKRQNAFYQTLDADALINEIAEGFEMTDKQRSELEKEVRDHIDDLKDTSDTEYRIDQYRRLLGVFKQVANSQH